MRLTIYPSKAKGVINAPPSKSIAHRALICGALSNGCRILNCGESQDVAATLRCLSEMGAEVKKVGDEIHVGGLKPETLPENAVLDCGESASTLRFLLPLCLLAGHKTTLVGHSRLMERPMTVYKDLCLQHGCIFEQKENSITVCGQLTCGEYSIPGNVSSQFVTGLLFAFSRITGESTIKVVGKLESAPYVDMTLAVLSAFGISVQREGNTFIINGNQEFVRSNYRIERDCSNAAILEAFNLLGGDVKVKGLTQETPQGDWVYSQLYADLVGGKRTFDLSNCPDLGPVMFALAAVYGGANFTGTSRLRIKESDRCRSMAEELAKFGIHVEIGNDSVSIMPGELHAPTCELFGHNDHRGVMALSLLCSLTGGTIDGAEAVSKSYPEFFEAIQSLGIAVKPVL